MPIVNSLYNPPWFFKNGHFSTIYSAFFRKVPDLDQERERLTLSDGDFLDIDWSFSEASKKKVAILLHGLEGNAQRSYIKGMAAHLKNDHWDVAAINFRGCSGETNRKYLSYNAGRTNDLEEIIDSILNKERYKEISLIGFSLGGNLLLKYLGERTNAPNEIRSGVAISAPVHLQGSLDYLSKPNNWIYRTSFLIHLRKKYKIKMEHFPDKMNKGDLRKIRSLLAFDNIYTAPAHGFRDAHHYYKKNSSRPFLPGIKIPVLIMNARNDTFLSPKCFPFEIAKSSEMIHLETPKYGGHVGFYQSDKLYYNEQRTLEFINQ